MGGILITLTRYDGGAIPLNLYSSRSFEKCKTSPFIQMNLGRLVGYDGIIDSRIGVGTISSLGNTTRFLILCNIFRDISL